MTVADTSIQAYHDLQEKFESQKEWVLYCVAHTYKPSSTDITNVSKLPRSSVTGRLNDLEKEGQIHKAGKKVCPFSHCMVYYYEVGPGQGVQL